MSAHPLSAPERWLVDSLVNGGLSLRMAAEELGQSKTQIANLRDDALFKLLHFADRHEGCDETPSGGAATSHEPEGASAELLALVAEIRAYGGDFPFLLSLKAYAGNPLWLPSAEQAAKARKCLNNYAQRSVQAALAAEQQSAPTKRCSGCRLVLPATEEHFAKNTTRNQYRYGLMPQCRGCMPVAEPRQSREPKPTTEDPALTQALLGYVGDNEFLLNLRASVAKWTDAQRAAAWRALSEGPLDVDRTEGCA